MNDKLLEKLWDTTQNLASAAKAKSRTRVHRSYKTMHSTLSKLYEKPTLETVMAVEKAIATGAINTPGKRKEVYQGLQEKLESIDNAEEALKQQKKNPAMYHAFANTLHTTGGREQRRTQQRKDGLAMDPVRSLLSNIRLDIVNKLSTADQDNPLPEKDAIQKLRHTSLAAVEREYLVTQHNNLNYINQQVREEGIKGSLKSFDSRIRAEQRKMEPTTQEQALAPKQQRGSRGISM